jgi:hypothetical protein
MSGWDLLLLAIGGAIGFVLGSLFIAYGYFPERRP